MEETGIHTNVYDKEGPGYYGNHATGNVTVIDMTESFFLDALENVHFNHKEGKAFTIADYGAADGSASMNIISKLIERIKEKYGANQEVHVFYVDQPENDFKSLFLGLNESNSYLKRSTDVFTSVCAVNFYEQCFPKNSINFAISTSAAMYSRKRPCTLKSSIFHLLSNNEDERKAFETEGKESWNQFLSKRAKELAPGGEMIIETIGVDDKGQFFGNTHRIKQVVYTNMDKHWKTMKDDGIITTEEYENTACTEYYLNAEQLSQPFRDETSDVYKAGIRLKSMACHFVPDAQYQAFIQAQQYDEGSCRKYAKRMIGSIRMWSNCVYMSGLSNNRSESEKATIVDEVYQRYEDEVAQSPTEHALDYVFHCLNITKILQ